MLRAHDSWGDELPPPLLPPQDLAESITPRLCEELVASFQGLSPSERVRRLRAVYNIAAYQQFHSYLVSAGAVDIIADAVVSNTVLLRDGPTPGQAPPPHATLVRYACLAAGRLALTNAEDLGELFKEAVLLLTSPLPDVAHAACYAVHALLNARGPAVDQELTGALLSCIDMHGDQVSELALRSIWCILRNADQNGASLPANPRFDIALRRASSSREAVASCRIMTTLTGWYPQHSERACTIVRKHLSEANDAVVGAAAFETVRVLSERSDSNRVALRSAFYNGKEAWPVAKRYMRTDDAVAEAVTGALCELSPRIIPEITRGTMVRWVFNVVAAMWIFEKTNINVMVYGCRFIKSVASVPPTDLPGALHRERDMLGEMGACEVVLRFMESSPVEGHALIGAETISALAEGHDDNQRRLREAGADRVRKTCLDRGLLVIGDATWPWISTDGPVAAKVRRTERLCRVTVKYLEEERGSRASERDWWGIQTCVVCRDRAATRRVLPCRCDNLCEQCLARIGENCPTCRGKIAGDEVLPTLNTMRESVSNLVRFMGQAPVPPPSGPAAASTDANEVEEVEVTVLPGSPGSYEPSEPDSEDTDYWLYSDVSDTLEGP